MTSTEKNNRLSKLDRLRKKIIEALREIEKEEQVTISFGSTSYDDTMFRTPMTITESADTKEVRELHTRKNLNLSLRYGFVGNIVGMKYNGGIITEFKTRNTKMPIILIKNGKSYKVSPATVKRSLSEVAIRRYNNLKELLEN